MTYFDKYLILSYYRFLTSLEMTTADSWASSQLSCWSKAEIPIIGADERRHLFNYYSCHFIFMPNFWVRSRNDRVIVHFRDSTNSYWRMLQFAIHAVISQVFTRITPRIFLSLN